MEKFTGKELDNDAGLNLYYFGARYYDAALGRFTSPDPLALVYSSYSPYNYAINNPLVYIDINGMAAAKDSSIVNGGSLPAIKVTALREMSNMGMLYLESWEGYKPYPYKDIAGYFTIGFGHKMLRNRQNLELWANDIKRPQAIKLLKADIPRYERIVREYLNPKVKLNQQQFDALVAFVYQETNFFSTSTLLRLINSGDVNPMDIARAFLMFNKYTDHKTGKLMKSTGITNRRVADSFLFNYGVYIFNY